MENNVISVKGICTICWIPNKQLSKYSDVCDECLKYLPPEADKVGDSVG